VRQPSWLPGQLVLRVEKVGTRPPLFGSPDYRPFTVPASVRADRWRWGRGLRQVRTPNALAVNQVPFAGIAFLWFIGMLRDRLGEFEDRFFATVFFGSGLL
jgi:hypothetical protein